MRIGRMRHAGGLGLPASLACALFGLSGLLMAADRAPSARSDPLQLVRTRNIFDPNRHPDRPREDPREERPRVRMDVLSLTGTMLHADHALAFFNGSESEYREVVSAGGRIAGFSVTQITTAAVELEKENTRYTLNVGQSLRRAGDEPWTLAQEAYMPERTGSDSPPRAASPAVAPGAVPAAVAGEASELMKRMMERRRQEESR